MQEIDPAAHNILELKISENKNNEDINIYIKPLQKYLYLYKVPLKQKWLANYFLGKGHFFTCPKPYNQKEKVLCK